MNALDTQTTIGQLVVERPARARIFERHGIDFCCGGKRPLAEACAKKSIDPETILREIAESDAAAAGALDAPIDWATEPLSDLVDHIVEIHHAYLREEMPRLSQFLDKLVEVHGGRHPELAVARDTFAALRQELESHMMKEECILFPSVKLLESSGGTAPLHCGSVENPIRVMILEHENAGDALETLRAVTNGYTPPADGCNTYRVTLDGLRELEADLHMHIHKENNILFPRAIELEASGSGSGSASG
jgi:regulator of cell morphogenesis and NO signaling